MEGLTTATSGFSPHLTRQASAQTCGEQQCKPALLLTKAKQDVDSPTGCDVHLRTNQIPHSHDAVLHRSAHWVPCLARHQQKVYIRLRNERRVTSVKAFHSQSNSLCVS